MNIYTNHDGKESDENLNAEDKPLIINRDFLSLSYSTLTVSLTSYCLSLVSLAQRCVQCRFEMIDRGLGVLAKQQLTSFK